MSRPHQFSALYMTILVIVVGSGALHADERRIFQNNAKVPWTVALVARPQQKEVGNMRFTINGRETVLGESGPTNTVTLPAGGQAEVEFTTTHGAYFHAFAIRSADNRWASLVADRSLASSLILSPKVQLGPLQASTNPPLLKVNEPVKGDLVILPDPTPRPDPRAADVAFELRNRTDDDGWRFSGGTELDQGVGKGTLKVDWNGARTDFQKVGILQKIPAQATYKFWLQPTPAGDLAQQLIIRHFPKRATTADQEYVFVVTGDPKKAFPEDLTVTQTKGERAKPWVHAQRLVFDGYLEIEDPDADVDFGMGDPDAPGPDASSPPTPAPAPRAAQPRVPPSLLPNATSEDAMRLITGIHTKVYSVESLLLAPYVKTDSEDGVQDWRDLMAVIGAFVKRAPPTVDAAWALEGLQAASESLIAKRAACYDQAIKRALPAERQAAGLSSLKGNENKIDFTQVDFPYLEAANGKIKDSRLLVQAAQDKVTTAQKVKNLAPKAKGDLDVVARLGLTLGITLEKFGLDLGRLKTASEGKP